MLFLSTFCFLIFTFTFSTSFHQPNIYCMKQAILFSFITIAYLNLFSQGHIKQEIINRVQQHFDDLKRLDFERVMTLYADTADFAMYGDGNYWGNYETVRDIWKAFTGGVKQIIKWDLMNVNIYPFSATAASALMDYDNERVEGNGDTTKVTGTFSCGMQKINGEWKVVTMLVTHDYKEGYGKERHNKNWWKAFARPYRK